MLLKGERVELRPTAEDDVAALVEILAEPDVLPWWGRWDEARVRETLAKETTFAIVVGGAVAGWMHVDEETEPDYPSVAFDVVVGGSWRGLGLGREALRVAIRHFIAKGHHLFTIDPAAANERAIRAYAAVGFKPVGVMRAYDRGPDGRFRDGLLMDLLADELID